MASKQNMLAVKLGPRPGGLGPVSQTRGRQGTNASTALATLYVVSRTTHRH